MAKITNAVKATQAAQAKISRGNAKRFEGTVRLMYGAYLMEMYNLKYGWEDNEMSKMRNMHFDLTEEVMSALMTDFTEKHNDEILMVIDHMEKWRIENKFSQDYAYVLCTRMTKEIPTLFVSQPISNELIATYLKKTAKIFDNLWTSEVETHTEQMVNELATIVVKNIENKLNIEK